MDCPIGVLLPDEQDKHMEKESGYGLSGGGTLAMLQEENSLILIVENSTKAEKIDLARIFEKDYSTKGEGRGLGL